MYMYMSYSHAMLNARPSTSALQMFHQCIHLSLSLSVVFGGCRYDQL